METRDKKYWLLGSVWQGENGGEQLERFLHDGIWENNSSMKFVERVKSVEEGDSVAIKSFFYWKNKGQTLRIKAMGTVTKNPRDGKRLYIDWEKGFKEFNVFNISKWDRIHQVTKKDEVQAIFFNKGKDAIVLADKSALNQIFYGPPGTGKTWNARREAEKMIIKNESV